MPQDWCPDPGDVDNAAAVFARFAIRLNPKVDEHHAFCIARDFIFAEGLALDNVDDFADLIIGTCFDPKTDIIH